MWVVGMNLAKWPPPPLFVLSTCAVPGGGRGGVVPVAFVNAEHLWYTRHGQHVLKHRMVG
jgi:hypothetical protein